MGITRKVLSTLSCDTAGCTTNHTVMESEVGFMDMENTRKLILAMGWTSQGMDNLPPGVQVWCPSCSQKRKEAAHG